MSVEELTDDLRSRFGHIRHGDVLRALRLLETAKLAEATGDGRWLVAWNRLPARGERELQVNGDQDLRSSKDEHDPPPANDCRAKGVADRGTTTSVRGLVASYRLLDNSLTVRRRLSMAPVDVSIYR